MVMPRAFSSGALSIESNDRNWIFGLCFDNTLVIAAVSVVLPWSMWPIVPTFTCGLVRSNFSFAISVPQGANPPRFEFFYSALLVPLRPGDDLIGLAARHLFIAREVHRVFGASLGA